MEPTYHFHRTEVPCPNCFKAKVLQATAKLAYCDQCGQEYWKDEDSNSLKYIEEAKPKVGES